MIIVLAVTGWLALGALGGWLILVDLARTFPDHRLDGADATLAAFVTITGPIGFLVAFGCTYKVNRQRKSQARWLRWVETLAKRGTQ